MSTKVSKQQQSTPVSTQLLEIQRRIEALYDVYKRDEEFQFGLNFAVSGIEQALGAAEFHENPEPDPLSKPKAQGKAKKGKGR